MKFVVEFVNEADLAPLLDPEGKPITSKQAFEETNAGSSDRKHAKDGLLSRTKSFRGTRNHSSPRFIAGTRHLRYEMQKGADLDVHIAQIHKAFSGVGIRFVDPATCFTLRVRPLLDEPPVNKEISFPLYLSPHAAKIDQQIVDIAAAVSKASRRKGFLLEYLLSPQIRAKRSIELIQKSSADLRALKEAAFLLGSQIQDQRFAEEFAQEGGVPTLLDLLNRSKGNTTAYAINALGAILQSSSSALTAFLNNGGLPQLFHILGSSNLLATRRATEVLRMVCFSDTWESFYKAATKDENRGMVAVFNQLEAADLHTRVAALWILIQLIKTAPSAGQKEEIIALIKEKDVELSLQRSLHITTPEMATALRQYELVSGAKLSEAGSTLKWMKQRIKELEKQVAQLSGEQVNHSPPPERQDDLYGDESQEHSNDDSDPTFTAIDFAEELRILESLEDLESGDDDEFMRTPHSARTKTAFSEFTASLRKKTDSFEPSDESPSPQVDNKDKSDDDDLKQQLVAAQEQNRELKSALEDLQNKPPSEPTVLQGTEEQIELLQQEKTGLEMEKYQLNLDISRLKQEYSSIKEKKKKLRKVVSNLNQKRTTLLEECSHSQTDLDTLREEFRKLTLEGPKLDDELPGATEEDGSRIARLEKLVCSLIEQKRILTDKLSDLQARGDESSADE